MGHFALLMSLFYVVGPVSFPVKKSEVQEKLRLLKSGYRCATLIRVHTDNSLLQVPTRIHVYLARKASEILIS